MPRFEPLPERRPAIVAGASSRIGEATAIELAAHGFPVALGARRVEKLDDIVGKINADGGEAVGFHLDVTDPNSVKSFVAQSVDALGDIEVLVAGAGDTYFGKLAEITTDEFESQLQIHLVGANRLAAAVLPGMLDRQRGDLIFGGSDVGLRPPRPGPRSARWSPTSRWNARAPACGPRSCIPARRRRRWAGACRPRRSA